MTKPLDESVYSMAVQIPHTGLGVTKCVTKSLRQPMKYQTKVVFPQPNAKSFCGNFVSNTETITFVDVQARTWTGPTCFKLEDALDEAGYTWNASIQPILNPNEFWNNTNLQTIWDNMVLEAVENNIASVEAQVERIRTRK